ncbi:hypothetical protein CDO73_22665 [Saccharibacillus sp. O23]|uniref:TPM domain-containing protein n=1 Tax=Saccharibacillus sp. O23 TaxID=2009338 RepID=UPI000B4E6DF3|nr:TPM domain-containing protein [Saccharibacillus sp. O23]OWR27060.1 hypothetical protein CDO73_22665 [Saccharibacillus sp. O23]
MRKKQRLRLAMLTMATLLLISGLLGAAGSAWAAAAQRSGIVTDEAGLFTSAQVKRLENELDGGTYRVYVLTESGLSDGEAARLSKQTYDSWNLGKNELLLLIVTDPNSAHLELNNQALGSAQRILDRAFVPAAGEDGPAAGALAVGEYVNGIGGAGASSGKGFMAGGSWLYVVLALGVVAIALYVLISMFRAGSRVKKRAQDLRGEQQAASAAVDGIMVSELFREVESGFVQGETLKEAESISREAVELHQSGGELAAKIAAYRPGTFASGSQRRTLDQLTAETKSWTEKVAGLNERFERVSASFAEVRRRVKEGKALAEETGRSIDSLRESTGYPLDVLGRRFDEASALLQKADNLDEFDVMQAAGPAEEALTLLQELSGETEELNKLAAEAREWPGRIVSAERELRPITERENLLLTEEDPFRVLSEAGGETERLGDLIRAGDVKQAQACAAGIAARIAEARDIVNRRLRSRTTSAESLRDAEALLREIEDFGPRYEQESAELLGRYAESHIREQRARKSEIEQAEEEIRRMLPEIRSALNPQVQYYKAAREKSDRVDELALRARERMREALGYGDELEAQRRAAEQRLQGARSVLRQAEEAYRSTGVQMPEYDRALETAQREGETAEAALRAQPTDLLRAEPMLAAYERGASELAQQIRELQAKRNEVYGQLERLSTDFLSRERSYQGRMQTRPFAGRYGDYEAEARRLIAIGRFEEALAQAGLARQVIEDMEREYRRAVQRANQNNRGGGGGFGGGFGGSGGRSSGGSSWGGSGRSGGSSSWGKGGGGGRSSGSAKW